MDDTVNISISIVCNASIVHQSRSIYPLMHSPYLQYHPKQINQFHQYLPYSPYIYDVFIRGSIRLIQAQIIHKYSLS